MHEFDNIKQKSGNYISEVTYPSSYAFVEEAERAFLKGIKIKNCFLCRYHAINTGYIISDEFQPIFCKFYKSAKNSNFAAQCEIYRPDKKVFRSNES